jgi:hypothetical protein
MVGCMINIAVSFFILGMNNAYLTVVENDVHTTIFASEVEETSEI